MLGPYSALPVLKGWEYRLYQGARIVNRGETIEVVRVNETGLIMATVLVTTDAFGSVVFEGQGAELRSETFEYAPEDLLVSGNMVPDPVGYLSRYYRPNPNSTAGLYVLIVAAGYWGAPLPFVPSVVVKLRLRPDSTQSQAYISVTGRAINVQERDTYIQSIRRLLDAKADLKIDPAFLSTGPAEFQENPK